MNNNDYKKNREYFYNIFPNYKSKTYGRLYT